MAAVTVDPTLVKYDAIARSSDLLHNLVAGVAIELGDNVYLDVSANNYKIATTLDAETSLVVGVAITRAASGGHFSALVEGELYGLTLTAGESVVLSATGGGFDQAPLTTGGIFPCGLGIAKSTTVLNYKINPAGVAI